MAALSKRLRSGKITVRQLHRVLKRNPVVVNFDMSRAPVEEDAIRNLRDALVNKRFTKRINWMLGQLTTHLLDRNTQPRALAQMIGRAT